MFFRIAAERRERDTLLAAAAAVSAGGSGLLGLPGVGQNSMCPSPSAHSDSSSNDVGRLSSAGSEGGIGMLNNNNNNNNCNSKLSDILRGATGATNNGHLSQQYSVDDLHSANRNLALMTAAGLGSPDSTNAVQAAVVNLAAAMRQQQQIQNNQQNNQQNNHQHNQQNNQQNQQQPIGRSFYFS